MVEAEDFDQTLSDTMALRNGTMLGRYRIEQELGEGRAGVVYRAFDTAIERIVAIKCLRAESSTAQPEETSVGMAVLDEAKVIGQFNHPHITAVYDMGASGGVSYIVMEYVQGEPLNSRIAQTRTDPASAPQILSFIVMVARALHYVHQRGILHGDIKPANLIVTPQGTPKIMDFGIARRRQGKKASWSLAGESHVWGTLGYVAPEQLVSSEVDARADVFSLGVVAYEWLAGRKPFQGDTLDAVLGAMLHSRPTKLSELGDFDSELSTAINQALAPDPARRFNSADVMADALEICQERCFKPAPNGSQSSAAAIGDSIPFLRIKGRNILFADFSEEDLAKVMQMSRQDIYRAGDTIIKEGAGGSTMYFVVRGRVSVRKMSGAQEIEIKQLSSGDCFGEMSVISQLPRSATVVALQKTEVIAISGAVLRSADCVLCMKLYRNIASLLADRVRQRDEQSIVMGGGSPENATPAKRRFSFW